MGGFISRSAQRYRELSLPFGLLEKLGLETQGWKPGECFNPCTASPRSVDQAVVWYFGVVVSEFPHARGPRVG